MKELMSLDIKFPKSIEVLVRIQCKKCNGTGFVLKDDAKEIREKYKRIVSTDHTLEEKKEIDKEILDFELKNRYNPLAQFAKCETCENSGQLVKYIDVRKLINSEA